MKKRTLKKLKTALAGAGTFRRANNNYYKIIDGRHFRITKATFNNVVTLLKELNLLIVEKAYNKYSLYRTVTILF